MTDNRIRTRIAPISKYQPFGCMTIPILLIAAVFAVRLVFAGALSRHWRTVRRFVTGV